MNLTHNKTPLREIKKTNLTKQIDISINLKYNYIISTTNKYFLLNYLDLTKPKKQQHPPSK
jgi:hypothetical protein